jgi:hypothetical protein
MDGRLPSQKTFEQLTGSREQFGVENTRRVLCWDNTSG